MEETSSKKKPLTRSEINKRHYDKYPSTEKRKAAKREQQRKWREANPELAKSQAKARYSRNPEVYHQRMKDWKKKNPERWAIIQRKTNLMSKYKITLVEYEELLSKQGGKCAICYASDSGQASRSFPVDHDHVSGKVRGLLCNACNGGIGLLRDDVEILKSAISYLERHKAEHIAIISNPQGI